LFGVSDEEIQRLANRLAMLVSDDGEADNAGRAVGALARRLGLSGGQLKAIFMAGAESANLQTARFNRLQHEHEALQAALDDAMARERRLERECVVLREEADALHAALLARQAARRSGAAVAVALLLALLAVGTVAWVAAGRDAGLTASNPEGAPQFHTAIVRDRPTALHSEPGAAAPVLAMLPMGTRMMVQRVLWHDLMQWVEVQADGRNGYVLSTEVLLY
jgi:hypothetical protein